MQKDKKRDWSFVTYGTSVDTKDNGYSGSVDENNLSVWSLNGKGKLVPASTDGLAFYYTVLDPWKENFTISADITVEKWTYSNGQDGFGIMVCDSVGENGEETSFWNNSYMAAVTKITYYYDREKQKVSDAGDCYQMELGICAREKKGVTADALFRGEQVRVFRTSAAPLETIAAQKGMPPGTYNIAGAYTNEKGTLTDIAQLTVFHLSIKRDNSGYVISYRDEQGVETSRRYYREDGRDELTRLDNGKIFAGFFAARNAKIAVRNVKITTVAPEKDEAPCMPPISYVTPEFRVESAPNANREDYELVCYGNADGILQIKDSHEKILFERFVKAFTKSRTAVKLEKKDNCFDICFTPDSKYKPSKYEELSSYETKKILFSVYYYDGSETPEMVYIHPDGTEAGLGTRENPVDIYTALRSAVPGQKLLLYGGTYRLKKQLPVARGMDGSPEAPIELKADPLAADRPVLDFCREAEGMNLAGNYWHFEGFDVTNTVNASPGIRLGGSYNRMKNIRIYKNGNTGLQISRHQINDAREEWPAHNHIINCTAYLNADPGYTDADGFAAKLSVGEGNLFDGCISAYNADDGFDLFAKVERGPIGPVTIENCIAFKNGYVLDKDGNEVHRGLGNGFKLGGSSLPAGHILKNSIAFANGEKGIDSNSCPDAKVFDTISYNNESHNVALFTTDAPYTDFYVRGVLSFKDCNSIPEQIEGRGKQKDSDIYDESNFFFDGEKSVNTAGKQVKASWFLSLDVQKAIHGGICRDAEGSICRNGFLERKEEEDRT